MKNFRKHLSEFINYIRTDKIRRRQLCAVVCIFGMLILLNIYSSEINSLNSNRYKKESVTAVSKPVDTIYASYAGVTAELGRIMKEVNTEVNEKSSIVLVDKVSVDKTIDKTFAKQETVENKVIKETTVEEESEEIKPVRENILYYVIDDGYTFYLEEEYQDYLWNKLKEYNHTELYEVCLAQMYHESQFEKDIVSVTNDHGLMQINASNYSWLHNTLNIDSLDDPYENIDCGIYILVSNVEKYDNIEEALIAYNQGYCDETKSTKYSRCILNYDMGCLHVLETN